MQKNNLIQSIRYHSKNSIPDKEFKNNLKVNLNNKINRKSHSHNNILHSVLAGSFILFIFTVSIVSVLIFRMDSTDESLRNNSKIIDTAAVKKAANDKFASLNNKVNFADIQAISTNSDSNEILVDQNKAKELADTIKTNDKNIFYSEKEFSVNNLEYQYFISLYFGTSERKHPSIDYSQPIITKNWYDINYSKFVILQNDKIILENITAPLYSLTYLGGDYAILNKFDTQKYFGGYTASSQNAELTFIKDLIKSPDKFKITDTAKINNKVVDVYESNEKTSIVYPDPANVNKPLKEVNLKEKFYVDPTSLELYKHEKYFDNVLAITELTKTESILNYEKDESEIINYKDLQNIDVKNESNTNLKYDLSDLSKDIKVIYIPELTSGITNIHNYTLENKNVSENSSKFNPIFTANEANVTNSEIDYTQGNLHVSVTKDKPAFDKTYTNLESQLTVDIKISDQNLKADYTIERIKDYRIVSDSKDINNYIYHLSFLYNNKYYVLSEIGNFEGGKIVKATMPIYIATAEKINELIMLNVQNALFPPTSFTRITLSQIENSSRYLPGKTIIDDWKLYLYSVEKSSIKSSDSNCVNTNLDKVDCLTQTFDGYELKFLKDIENNTKAEDKEQRFLNYLILNTSAEKVKTFVEQNMKDVFADKYGEKDLYSIKEINGKTIFVITNLLVKQDILDSMLKNISLDNGLKEIDTTYKY